jgi:hypothetical protein
VQAGDSAARNSSKTNSYEQVKLQNTKIILQREQTSLKRAQNLEKPYE